MIRFLLFAIFSLCCKTAVSQQWGCKQILQDCYGGQFGYTDPNDVALALHMDVMSGRSSPEQIEHFCGVLDELITCIAEPFGVCPASSPLYVPLGLAGPLGKDLCTFTNDGIYINPTPGFQQYKTCLRKQDVADKVQVCNSYLSFNYSDYSVVFNKAHGLEQRCRDFNTFQDCLTTTANDECFGDVYNWLTAFSAKSYLRKVCEATFGYSHSSKCVNVIVLDSKRNLCHTAYTEKLPLALIEMLYNRKTLSEAYCGITRDYATCEFEAVAEHCGLAAAQVEREQWSIENKDLLKQISCIIGDVVISTKATPAATTRTTTSTSATTTSIATSTTTTPSSSATIASTTASAIVTIKSAVVSPLQQPHASLSDNAIIAISVCSAVAVVSIAVVAGIVTKKKKNRASSNETKYLKPNSTTTFTGVYDQISVGTNPQCSVSTGDSQSETA